MKTTTFLKQAFLLGVVVCSSQMWGQLFQQDFNSSSTVSDYVNSTTPNSGQFNAISSSGSGTVLSITNGKLRFSRTGNAGAYTRTTDLSPTPQFMIYQFELTIGNNSAAVTNAAAWQIGSGFGTANSTESNTSVHSRIGLNLTTTNGSFSLRDIGASANSAVFSGTQNVFWVINNTGSSVSYLSPNNTIETLSNDNADIWIGSTKALSAISATTSTQSLTDFKFVISNGTVNVDIDNFKIFSGSNITTWNGSAWSNGDPTSLVNAIIDGDYTGTSFATASLTVNSGKTLTITNGNTVTATNVTNNGSIVVENGGNFIQATGGTYANSGNFTVNKNTASAINKYVFWASPTASQNMFGIHTTTPQYVMTYNSDTDYYNTLTNPATSTPGVGYSVKMPSASAAATFGGASAQPNNGDVAVTLNNTSVNKYNLIGNPYPSNVDLNAFYNANSSSMSSTFWFWDNTSNSVTTQTGNTTTNVGYATYNAAGSGTWTEAPSSSASHSGNAAAIGQGFIVEATGTTATFTNAMRVSTSGNTFNKLNGNDTGKFWLKLATPYGSHTTLAVNYEGGALNGYDKYDSNAMGVGSDAFYSTIGSEKLVIQGKSPFTVDDVVSLGNKHFEAGNFVISLIQKEGLFNNGQAIYLHDKDLGTYTNLQNGNYSFSANAGEFTNRFEIVYKLGVLATQEIEKTTFEVYRDGEGFVARNNKNIEVLEIFDASGRKIIELKPNASSAKFKIETKGMYILRATSAGKEYTKKLIK